MTDAAYETILFDASGGRVSIAPERMGILTWVEDVYGKYGEFNLPLNALTSEFLSIQPRYRVEQWFAGRRLYRGYVFRRGRQIESPNKLLLQGYGRMNDLAQIICTSPVILATTADLADLVTQVLAIWVRPIYSSSVLLFDVPATGINIYSYDCTDKSVKQVLDDLCDLTGFVVHWGCDVNTAGIDRLYLRLVGQTTHVVSVPGREVTAASGEVDASDVVNRCHFTGGQMAAFRQNLVLNGSFEKPVNGSDVDGDGVAYGNILTNPGFEIGGVHNAWSLTGWTQVGAASAKQNGGGDGGAGGDPGDPDAFSGTWCIELSDYTEEAYQDVAARANTVYGIRAHARPSDIYTTAVGKVLIEWYSGGTGGTLLSTSTLAYSVATAAWTRFEEALTAPASADACRVRLTADNTGGTNSLLYDAISLWCVDTPVQQEWQLTLQGTGSYTADWANTDAKHGAYSLQVNIGSLGGGAWVLLSPRSQIAVIAGSRLIFYTWFKVNAAYAWDVTLYVYDASGTLIATQNGSPWIGASASTGWETRYDRFDMPPKAVKARWQLRLSTVGTWNIDALTLMDERGAAELAGIALSPTFGPSLATPGDGRPYQPDGNLSLIYNAQDLVSSGEDADVNGSQSTWGIREGRESADSIVTYADVRTLLKGYFKRRAKAVQKPALTLVGGERDLRTGDLVRLVGEDGPALCGSQTLPITRLRGNPDGTGLISQGLEIGRPLVTIAALIRQAAIQEIVRKR